jgi:hypothetical protein
MTKSAEIPSNIPQAARKQIKAANQLIAELNAKPGDATPNLTALARPGFVPGSAAPAPAEPPAAPAPTARPVAPNPPEDPVKVVEHKYNVLQGKYNAEMARMAGMIETMRADNERLLQLARQAPAPAPQGRPEDQFDLTSVTAKEREEFGEELVQLMARIAKANSGAEVRALQAEVNRLKGSVQTTVAIGAETRMEKVWQQLDAWNTDWRVINNSQQFVDWLQNIDIMSGRPRQEGLTAAFDSGNGTRVVGIFKRFVEEDSSFKPTAAPTPPQAPVDQATLVAPSAPRGDGGGAPNGSSGKIWSEQEIDDFYSRVQRGRITPEEKASLEKEIMAAVSTGRVVPRRDERHLANSR